MTVYHFNYDSFLTEVCEDVGSCVWDLHLLGDEVIGRREANDLFVDYIWYEHELSMAAVYTVMNSGKLFDYGDSGYEECMDLFSPMSFDDFIVFKKNEVFYNHLLKNTDID